MELVLLIIVVVLMSIDTGLYYLVRKMDPTIRYRPLLSFGSGFYLFLAYLKRIKK